MVARNTSYPQNFGKNPGGSGWFKPPLETVFVSARKGMKHVSTKVPVMKEMKHYGGLYSYKNKAQYHQKKKASKIIFTGAKSGNVKGVSNVFGTQKGARKVTQTFHSKRESFCKKKKHGTGPFKMYSSTQKCCTPQCKIETLSEILNKEISNFVFKLTSHSFDPVLLNQKLAF